MIEKEQKKSEGWQARKRRERGHRALARQREYQEKKAAGLSQSDDIRRSIFLRSQMIRQKLSSVRPIAESDKVLEVGSGAHGLVFGLGSNFAVGVDPLAVDYKRLFPSWQENAVTAAAMGEQLPFEDASFDVVLSENVIDHAERPLQILNEIDRVLKPGGILYFTVNVHHPVYEIVSRAHGLWNALGLKFELSPFADHTVHFTEPRIRDAFSRLSVQSISQSSTVSETRRLQRNSGSFDPDSILKKVFFKNALFEVVALKN